MTVRHRPARAFAAVLALAAALAAAPAARAQALGTVCEVPSGRCVVAAQPVGSVCFCGRVEGRIAADEEADRG